jgi:hypothetical protein
VFWRCQLTSDGISLILASLLGIRHRKHVSKRHGVCPNMCYHRGGEEQRWYEFAGGASNQEIAMVLVVMWESSLRLSRLLRGKHFRAFEHMFADHLECFFPCFLHLRSKTGTEIVVERFEQHYSEHRIVFCF